jgi:hypothetical protein
MHVCCGALWRAAAVGAEPGRQRLQCKLRHQIAPCAVALHLSVRFSVALKKPCREVAPGSTASCCRPPLTAAAAATGAVNSEAGCAHIQQLVLRPLVLHVLSPAKIPNSNVIPLPVHAWITDAVCVVSVPPFDSMFESSKLPHSQTSKAN